MFSKIILLAGMSVVVLFISACAFTSYQTVNPTDYPEIHKNFDATIGWSATRNSGLTKVAGYVRNNRYSSMQDLELRVSHLDAAGVEMEQKIFFVIPSSLPLDEVAGFSVEFSNDFKPGDKLRFFYRYKGVEDNEDALPWMSSFEVSL